MWYGFHILLGLQDHSCLKKLTLKYFQLSLKNFETNKHLDILLLLQSAQGQMNHLTLFDASNAFSYGFLLVLKVVL